MLVEGSIRGHLPEIWDSRLKERDMMGDRFSSFGDMDWGCPTCEPSSQMQELHLTENPLTDLGVTSLLQARKDGALQRLAHLGLEGTRTSAQEQIKKHFL